MNWRVELFPDYQGQKHLTGALIVSDAEIIAEVRGAVLIDGEPSVSNMPNAHRLAAAPELYEALRETRTDLTILRGHVADAARRDHRWEGMADTVKGWIERIDAALAKARGEPTPSPNDRSGA